MNIQIVVSPYELLFRLTKQGTIQGCHRKDIQELVDLDTGTVYNTKELDPTPIQGAGIDAVLGTVNSSLVATLLVRDNTITALSAEKEAILGALQQLQTDHSTLQQEKQYLLDDLADRAATILDLQETIAGLHNDATQQSEYVLSLQETILDLQAQLAAAQVEAPAQEAPPAPEEAPPIETPLE